MTLAQLVEELPVTVPPDSDLDTIRIGGLSHDSRRVGGGDLYVGWRGERFDGRAFVSEAIARGAVAVLIEGPANSDALPDLGSVPCLVADEPHRLLAPLAARLYDRPDRKLLMVGVTGTNGKTSVAHLVAGLVAAAGQPAATLGTLGYWFDGVDYGRELGVSSTRTTPEASDLERALAAMYEAGAVAAAMEVSSHALSLARVEELAFDVGVFLQLGRDHLDFHRDLDDYFEAKARLFELLKPGGKAVIGVGEPYGQRLAERVKSRLTFGPGGDFELDELEATVEGIKARALGPTGPIAIRSPLIGRFHADNLLAAIATATALGIEPAVIEEALPSLEPIPGRMEPVVAGQPFPVFVDYAHTGEALGAALGALRELWPGKIQVVFGCGGERDLGKRAPMGRVAASLADRVVVTDDNPRGEDPAVIHRAIVAGIEEKGEELSRAIDYSVIPSRRAAIRESLELAQRQGDWAVLIAGKGHEETQSIGGREIEFSDRREAALGLGEALGPSKTR